jgi:hypothetical protein
MPYESSRTNVILRAIRTAAKPLSTLPESSDVRVLRDMAADFEKTVRGWKPAPPRSEERELMMKRVLALNIAVAKLVRETQPR